MKIYLSIDFEGLPFTTHWDEVTRWKPDFPPFQSLLLEELIATCNTLNKCGAKEIWVKDAHGVGRGFLPNQLPSNITLIRGHSGHPFGILQEIDSTFDAVVLLGSHAGAGMDYSNLEHTINDEEIAQVKINNLIASEFLIQAYTAEYVGVPVVFVSGDSGICGFINNNFPKIKTVTTKKCVGNSTISIQSEKINDSIKNTLVDSLNEELSQYRINLPKDFSVEIQYFHQHTAYKNSFYPDMKKKDGKTLFFQSSNFFEVLRMMQFVLW